MIGIIRYKLYDNVRDLTIEHNRVFVRFSHGFSEIPLETPRGRAYNKGGRTSGGGRATALLQVLTLMVGRRSFP